MKKSALFYFCFFALNSAFFIAKSQDITLPAPVKTGGKPLMQALNDRQSVRTFTKENLTLNQLSDLLWAGWGFNSLLIKREPLPHQGMCRRLMFMLHCSLAPSLNLPTG